MAKLTGVDDAGTSRTPAVDTARTCLPNAVGLAPEGTVAATVRTAAAIVVIVLFFTCRPFSLECRAVCVRLAARRPARNVDIVVQRQKRAAVPRHARRIVEQRYLA